MIPNLATSPSGINGTNVGGIAGQLTLEKGGLTGWVNAMIGNISGLIWSGGLIGRCFAYSGTDPMATLVNSMTGNITIGVTPNASLDTGVGGIMGYLYSAAVNTHFMNYMSGDRISLESTAFVGGILGQGGSASGEITSSMNAMNDNVENAIVGNDAGNISFSTTTRNTAFGLTYNVDTTTPVDPTDVLYPTDFMDLPYVVISATSPDAIDYDFDFIFANLAGSGNSSYNIYTHCVLHKGDIAGPLRVDFDVLESNTTLYTTFINYPNETVVQNALTRLLAY
ncbi:unnamed protein product [Pylaiella littoralis]